MSAAPPGGGHGPSHLYGEFAETLALARGDRSFRPGDLGSIFAAARCREYAAREIRELWLRHAAAAEKDPSLRTHLCIATPFCRSRCDFCIFFKRVLPSPAALEEYAAGLCAAADYFGAALEKLRLFCVYFEGGTPTLFSARQLERICAAVFGRVRFEVGDVRDVEVSPESATREKLAVLRRWGFNKVSIGVQSLSPAVLRAVNRVGQSATMVERTLEDSRRLGFGEVSVDLILGLPGGGEKFLDSFSRLVRMGPDSIVVYPCAPTAHYLNAHFSGDRGRFDRHLRHQRRWLEKARAWAAGRGFAAAEVERNPGDGVKFCAVGGRCYPEDSYNEAGGGASMFSLGLGRSGSIAGRLKYEPLSLGRDASRGRFGGRSYSSLDGMRLFLLDRLSSGGRVGRREFRGFSGKDLDRVFGPTLTRLRDVGLIADDGAVLSVVPGTRREVLFAGLMALLDQGTLVREINRMMGKRWLVVKCGGAAYHFNVLYSPTGRGFKLEGPETGKGPLDDMMVKAVHRVFDGVPVVGIGMEVFRREFLSRLRVLESRLAGGAGGLPLIRIYEKASRGEKT